MEPRKLPQTVPFEELYYLLPHKDSMFLLDHLTAHDIEERTLESESLITKDHIFYNEDIDGINSYVAFELIAQSISALSGVTGCERGEPPKPGFLLSLLSYEAKVPYFKAGTSVHVKIKKVDELDNILTYYGEASSSENPDEVAVAVTVSVMETTDLRVLENR
ncbi:MAG: 3-hydroxylacyl-ACP dehydratase [Treponema sp.]|nr:3-hydroxylacyl-ACP dehydratase [Treponema sp.]